ncbi:MAG: NINE protein [Muribaculaceae bacterium]|nr:NINE protein [Muribaculaceae bacterium]MBR5117687.1 NINE protein [Muribaculaceae bacterium]
MATTYKCPNCGNTIMLERPVQNITCPYCNTTFSTVDNQQPPQFGGNQQQYGQQQPYGQPQYGYQQPYRSNDVFAEGPSGKSRGIAALLAILVGAIGVHYFYLGKTTPGIVFLVASLLTCGILATVTSIISLIQGIMMFTMSQQEFEDKYTNPAVSFPLF